KGLGQVVVGTGIEPGLLVIDGSVTGQHDDGSCAAGLTKPSENVYAGAVRKLPVENHQVVVVALQVRPTFETGGGNSHCVLLESEPVHYRLRYLGIVINYQDSRHDRY